MTVWTDWVLRVATVVARVDQQIQLAERWDSAGAQVIEGRPDQTGIVAPPAEQKPVRRGKVPARRDSKSGSHQHLGRVG